jgi:hypothetical protein
MWRLINHDVKRIVIQMLTEIEVEFEVNFEPAAVPQNS